MGNKRITENDFWQCTNGAVPAQLQGSNKTTKKASGEKYITVNDKATSSWIDFGCTKLMLIYALLAAAVVVIAAMTVATGGAALIALGALAGLAGAAWGAVVGSMLCGHLGAKIRKWVEVPKANKTVIQGVTQVTGDFKMTCMIPGGIVTFNPKIKSWNQAIALGASNYLGKLMEGMMAGAAVGMAGALWAGGASAFTSGGIRGIGQAAWQFAKSCPMNVVKNIAASFGYAGAGASTTAVWTTVGTAVGLRTATATQAGLGHYGTTGESGWGAAGSGVFAMETGMYESGHNMAGSALGWKKEDGTGYSTSWQDVAGMAMLLSPVHKAPEELTSKAEPKSKAEEAVNDGETKKTDEEQTVKDANVAESEAGGPAGEGETFEARIEERRISDELYDELREQTPTQEIRDMVNEGITLPMPDPVLPGLEITKRLHADHIVPMDRITRMEGFDLLTREQQLEVLNNKNNFTGLSPSANTSKGPKTFSEWVRHKSKGIDVDPTFRQEMIIKEQQLQGQLQKQIDDFLRANNGG